MGGTRATKETVQEQVHGNINKNQGNISEERMMTHTQAICPTTKFQATSPTEKMVTKMMQGRKHRIKAVKNSGSLPQNHSSHLGQFLQQELPASSPFQRNKTRLTTASLRRLVQLERTSRENFSFLECTFTLNEKKVNSAYRKVALKYHPDKPTGDKAKFQRLGNGTERVVANIRTLLSIHPELKPSV